MRGLITKVLAAGAIAVSTVAPALAQNILPGSVTREWEEGRMVTYEMVEENGYFFSFVNDCETGRHDVIYLGTMEVIEQGIVTPEVEQLRLCGKAYSRWRTSPEVLQRAIDFGF